MVQKCQLHQVLCQTHSNIAHKGRDKMDKYIKRTCESVSQEVIQPFVSLCSIHEEKSITSRQKQPILAPIQARVFLTHLQMDLMDLRNLPCICSCHRKHNWILHMIDHFTKSEEEEEEEAKRACYSLTKSTKEIRTPQQEKARNTQRKYKMTTSIPNTIYQQLCQNKN